MVVNGKYQRGVARSHARANLVSRALFPGFGGGAGSANWRHCFEGLQQIVLCNVTFTRSEAVVAKLYITPDIYSSAVVFSFKTIDDTISIARYLDQCT